MSVNFKQGFLNSMLFFIFSDCLKYENIFQSKYKAQDFYSEVLGFFEFHGKQHK